MDVRVLAPHVVRVVRQHEGEPEFLGELDDAPVHLVLLRDPVVLQFEPVPVAEHAGVPLRGAFRVVVALVLEVAGDLAGEARGQTDEALGVLLEDRVIDPRPPVEALRVADRGELDEVRVTGPVRGEQDEVRVVGRGARLHLAGAPVAVRDVGFAADDRRDALRAGLLLELPGAEQVAVVGEGERGHAERDRPVDQIVDPVRAVEQRVLAVRVKMNELHYAVCGVPAIRRSRSGTTRGFAAAAACTRIWAGSASRARHRRSTCAPGSRPARR